MIVIKVNLLFLAMAADREHAIPEILKVDGKWALITRDNKELPDLLEYAEILHDKFEDTEFDSYAREVHREARIFMDIVTPVMIEKWEKD
jgi:hypothetical protein